MSLKIFKPNPRNTGAAFTFNFGPAKKGGDLKGDLALYVSTVLQGSWNAAGKTGSFKENAKNPEKTLRMKLNEFEVGGLLNSIKRRVEFKGYHTHDGRAGHVQFSFTPSNDPQTNQFRGFFFSIARDNKDKFAIPVTAAEAETLAAFLDFGLKQLFANRFKVQFGNTANGQTPQAATPKPTADEQTVPEEDPFNDQNTTPASEPEPKAAEQSGSDENPFG